MLHKETTSAGVPRKTATHHVVTGFSWALHRNEIDVGVASYEDHPDKRDEKGRDEAPHPLWQETHRFQAPPDAAVSVTQCESWLSEEGGPLAGARVV